MKKKILMFTIIMGLLVLVGCTTSNIPTDSTEDDHIAIPISDISSNMLKITHESKGATISFFAVKGSDGKVRTAFDACDVCGGHKGYTQIGSDVRCNNCGRMFKIDDIGKVNSPGGCWPSYLSHTLEGDSIIIKKSEIEEGRWRFA